MSLSPGQQYILDFSDLCQTRRWSERDELLDKMEALHGKLSPASQEAIVLGFALAKIYDDLGEVDRSFALLRECNRHHRNAKTDTIEDARATVASLRELFSRQRVRPLSAATQARPRPVFILGMPRSGTSLVEQILASHSRVQGGGELKLMGQWCYGFLKRYRDAPEAMSLQGMLPELRQHYLSGIEPLGNEPVITDKMPMNFLWVGFILAALPEARIVHTTRDAMATCWSIYKTAFAGSSNGYSCDLGDIGEFYSLYRELMDFWRERFEPRFHELDYERLTQHQEAETRRLLDFCGLDWEPACLAFHRNPRRVKTASWAQVQRPLYRGSSEAWKPYEKYLTPLIEALR